MIQKRNAKRKTKPENNSSSSYNKMQNGGSNHTVEKISARVKNKNSAKNLNNTNYTTNEIALTEDTFKKAEIDFNSEKEYNRKFKIGMN